jgi:hypothetical protein
MLIVAFLIVKLNVIKLSFIILNDITSSVIGPVLKTFYSRNCCRIIIS